MKGTIWIILSSGLCAIAGGFAELATDNHSVAYAAVSAWTLCSGFYFFMHRPKIDKHRNSWKNFQNGSEKFED